MLNRNFSYNPAGARARPDERPAGHYGSAWSNAISHKIQFVLLAIGMFAVYGAVSVVLEHTGWRTRRTVETSNPAAHQTCEPAGKSLEAHAACVVARDDAREAERKISREKQAAGYAKRQAEEKALDNEIERQRAATKSARLKVEFDTRLDDLRSTQKRFASVAEKSAFREATLKALVGLLALTEGHPAKALSWKIEKLRASDAVAVIDMDGKENPNAKLRAQVDDICDARNHTEWRQRCGRLIKEHVVELPVYSMQYHLSALVASIPVGESK